MVACEECSSPQVARLRWYHWLELRSRWRRQQYSHFDTVCQRPKGKLHFLSAVMIPPSAARYFRHLPAMSVKTTLHATAPLLYPCRRYPKCPWGLYASPPPVAMAVVGWFLCFPAFFFLEKRVFFSHTRLTPKKKSLRDLHPKKKISVEKKTRLTPKKEVTRLTPKKKIKKRLTLISTIELRFPPLPPSLPLALSLLLPLSFAPFPYLPFPSLLHPWLLSNPNLTWASHGCGHAVPWMLWFCSL